MKHTRRILFLFISMLMIMPLRAEETDSEGYPVMYLRGDMDNLGWGCSPSMRFSRTGEDYSLHLDRLDGEFKIADSDWKLSYGSATGGVEEVYANTVINGVKSGAGRNFHASNLRDVTISFTLAREGECPISIAADTSLPITNTLPVVYIDTEDRGINDYNLSHKEYFSGTYRIENAGELNLGTVEEPLPLEIKARGNWTRTAFVKKPFKLKLGKKQALLGLTKSKHFALLAHADDGYGFLRNYTAFALGKRIGLPWTPGVVPVELVLNGDYRGIYFLTESIRVEEERVNISELADGCEDPALVSGGYIVELDNYEEPENQIRIPEISTIPGDYGRTLRITFDTPEIYSELQTRFITDQFNEMNRLVGTNDDAMWSYLDLDDAARYYIVCEITGHTEAYNGSTYLFRDRGEGEKWHFSPLWDFGNAFNCPRTSYFYTQTYFPHNWIPSFVRNQKFMDKVRETWKWLRGNRFDGFFADMTDYVTSIDAAAKADADRWRNAGKTNNDGVNVMVNDNVNGKRDEVESFLNHRLAWLDGIWGAPDSGGTEPARDLTPAAPLPDYARSGIVEILSDSDSPYFPNSSDFSDYSDNSDNSGFSDDSGCSDGLYTIEGIRVSNPESGHLYILIRGGKASKIIL